ncbi:MAG: efflux RND transporter periplasmic adaptor subunit [Rhodospirillales bacterium]|nr:MAG: efflux RND transporter periplasmic adaptor subunit [Rhodospirillales bacterium]
MISRGMAVQITGALLLLAAAVGLWLVIGHDAPNATAGGAGGGRNMPAPVMVAEARSDTVVERIEAVGTARARESVEVVAEVAGRVGAIGFQEGAGVTAGTVLIELSDARERAELREAMAQRGDAERQLERARQLLRSRNISQARVDELRAVFDAATARVAVIESELYERQIRAPFDGIVGLRDVSLGAFVSPGQRITTLDDIGVIRIEFSVPERFFGRLVGGLPVTAQTAAFADREFIGTISRIDSRIDPATRSVRVQAEFPNDDGRLRPGMFMAVRVDLEERDAVILAEEAVVSQGERHFVFVVEDGHAHRREVVLGLRRAGEVEVRTGVSAGQRIVTEGVDRVRDGGPVRTLTADRSDAPQGSASGPGAS